MSSRPARRARLSVEQLEARDTPASLPSATFDAATPGMTPPGWSSWASDGQPGWRVSADQAVAGRSLASSGGSTRAARAWLPATVPASATVTAAVRADTLIPAQVLARGTNLGTGRPTYYAASVARGVEVQLLRVTGGTATELATVKSAKYLSGVWLDLSLSTHGDRLQVRVRRRDTGAWLNPFGDWQVTPAAALNARDSAIRTAGQAGLGRAASYAGTLYFDEFRVTPARGDVVAPVVRARVRAGNPPARPGTVAGTVQFRARVTDAGRLQGVEFFVDGALVGRDAARPPRWDFDTRRLPNGRHTLTVRASDVSGNVGEAEVAFEVYNPPAGSRPAVPRHYAHIRYAALAYNGTPLGPAEQELLRTSVDLVIPNARYLAEINRAAPGLPQFVYSNVSNLYLDLLTDWLEYADRTGVPREGAFYHVARGTPFIGDSPSSQPVAWFWNVQRGPATGSASFVKLTAEARTAAVGDVRLGGVGESLYLGYPERFRELNLTVYQAPSVAWAATLEYPTRVDEQGRATVWKPLPGASDVTTAFRRSGRVMFDPPGDWVGAVLPGSPARLFYLRVRTTEGRAAEAPILSAVLGRDYVAAGGARAGTIPAFDAPADANRDGHLSDAEYARRRPGLDARFAYEGRLFFPHYGQMRFVTNPAGQGVAGWAADYHRRLLPAHPQAAGVFMDNSGGKAPTDGAALLEPTAAYPSDYAALLGTVNRDIAPKWVLANTSGGGREADRIAGQVPGTVEEFALRPLGHTWVHFRDTADLVARRLALDDPPGYLILDTLSSGGSPTDPRTRMSALAYYYLLADPEATFLMSWGGEEPASAWSRHWFGAIAFDVGRPKGAWSELTAGADPENADLVYRVYRREYANAVVMYKPLSYTLGKGTGGTGDPTATTHELNATYRPLQADGTLGPPATTVTLRNGEGAVLVRA